MSVVLQVQLDGGSWVSGNVAATNGQVARLRGQSMGTWGSPVARYEIRDYPPGYATPAGWTLESDGIISFQGNTETPPFTLVEGQFYTLRLYATEGGSRLVDESTGINCATVAGWANLGAYEAAIRFGSRLGVAGTVKSLLKYLYDRVGSFGAATASPTPSTIAARDASGFSAFVKVITPTVQPSSGSLAIKSFDTATNVGFYAGNTEEFRVFDDAGKAHLQSRSTTAGRLSANTNQLELACAAGSYVGVQENTTEICRFTDESNVSTIQGRGSSGTEFVANASNATLTCASGATIILKEGSTNVFVISDAAGVSTLSGQGATTNLTSAGSLLFSANSSLLAFECSTQCQFNNNGVHDFYRSGVLKRKRVDVPQVQTTDATVTTLYSLTLANSTTVTVDVIINATDGTTANAAGFRRVATLRTAGGTTTLVGAVSTPHTAQDGSLATTAVTIDASGSTFRIRVTGVAATNLRWEGCVTITYGAQYA